MTPAAAAMAAGMAAIAMAMDKKVPRVIRMAFSRFRSYSFPFVAGILCAAIVPGGVNAKR